jgi:hypothetical protein
MAFLLAGLALAQAIQDPPNPYGADNRAPVPYTGGIVDPPPARQAPPPKEESPEELYRKDTETGQRWNPLRFGLLAVGLVLAGGAVSLQFRSANWKFEGRLETAAVLGGAAVAGLLGYLGMARDWDSGHMLLIVTIVLTLAAAVVVLLPSPARRAVISAVVLFHFTGILVAITNQDPAGIQPPWLANKAWQYVYRPYLGFLYLNNAYHFYAPNPGPPDLLWFRIRYKNGDIRWVRLPERESSPTGLNYTRLIAAASAVSTPIPPRLLGDTLFELYRAKRAQAGEHAKIPFHPNLLLAVQYFEPTEISKVYMASYVRHIARTYPRSAKDPGVGIDAIKFYRIAHDMLPPGELAKGTSPLIPSLYRAYFMGEYNPNGSFTNPSEREGFLYWMLPIYYQPTNNGAGQELVDCLEKHATRPTNRGTDEDLRLNDEE